jgi:uncharacterized protein involved in exopolysaccharide biosynthesis/Mrp family chromosome partitioning ATPase
MKTITPQEPETGINLNDILFILFRHKGKIIISTLTGIVASLVFYFHFPIYESKAKLIVRYVLDRSPVDKVEAGTNAVNSLVGDAIINSEVEILNSMDLALQVAESVGPRVLLPKAADPNKDQAAGMIASGLKVSQKLGSNVITVSYRNRNPGIPKRIVEDLVTHYFDKHLQVHRSLGTFDYVMRETQKVRLQLHQTEEQLKTLKEKAGILSLAESTANISTTLIKSQEEFNAAEVERAEQLARVQEIEKWISGLGTSLAATPDQQNRNRDGIQEYQTLGFRLDDLRRRERDLLSKYTEENQQVKLVRNQIADIEKRRRGIEKVYPGILRLSGPATASASSPRFDLASEKTRLASIDAKTGVLSSQLHTTQEKAARIASIGTEIAQLERQKELEETNYRYFESSLEKARIDETLDPSKIPNISIVQNPTDAQRDYEGMNKIMIGLVGGGLVFGLALSFLIELLFDRTVKRPLEIESRLRLPLLVTIPYLPPPRNMRQPSPGEESESETSIEEVRKSEVIHQLHLYLEAIRDRLILYFELNKMMRKPKMIAVTGVSPSAGISTVAGGLAASLSETGEGKVLLVNMNVGHPEMHPFRNGKPVQSLVDILKTSRQERDPVHGLYLATAGTEKTGHAQFIPKKFYDLMPNLKESDFDYIIFDMPPLNQTSTTVAFAGFMDKVLMVIEAGASHPESLKRAYRELLNTNADVSCIFNKARPCAPKYIEGEI